MKIHGKYVKVIFFALAVAVLLGMVFIPISMAQQSVSSIRDSQYEWYCEEQDGTFISGHTRQDKAEQSCWNRALADPGVKYIVRGGTFRVTATGQSITPDPEPPVEPPVDPTEPPIPPTEPPPTDGALVTFGPVTEPITYPAIIAALKQDFFRWEITFTLNTIDNAKGGLVSRDESGQTDRGHLSVWIENGKIRVRNQDIAGGNSHIILDSVTDILAGQEYLIVVSMSTDVGLGLFVDGILEASNPLAYGLTGNDLPLVVGGSCATCTDTVGPTKPIDGTVYLEIWDDPLDLPEPIVGTTVISWVLPIERVDSTPLDADELIATTVYMVNGPAGDFPKMATYFLDGDAIMYEATDLPLGEQCFQVTATSAQGESDYSNTGCKTIQ